MILRKEGRKEGRKVKVKVKVKELKELKVTVK